ncbi:MAG: hypothetical protein FJ319_09815 [SAR202 cluster bacterium]|nr:hypothetical protein [SAR202 cluster bacterium]
MFSFSTDYYLMVAVAAFGVIQIAASIGGLRGLLLFKSPAVTRVLGAALILAALYWFFSSAPRNINDYEGGLDGNRQAVYFLLGAITATALTVLVSSARNSRLGKGVAIAQEGLDALRHANYLRALKRTMEQRRKHGAA